MKKLTRLLLSVFSFGVLFLGSSVPAQAVTDCAANPAAPVCQAQQGKNATTECGGGACVPLGDQIKNVVNILLFILGAIAVIMIVVGGLRYTLSAGDSSAITGAKNTILYAIIGLIVAILAYAIVNFVLGAF